MSLLRRIVRIFLVFPAVVVLAALGVVNDQPISLVLDPFQPANPAISVRPLPFYLYFFGALILGVVVGGVATWMTRARWRHRQVSGVRVQGAGPRPAQALLLKPDP